MKQILFPILLTGAILRGQSTDLEMIRERNEKWREQKDALDERARSIREMQQEVEDEANRRFKDRENEIRMHELQQRVRDVEGQLPAVKRRKTTFDLTQFERDPSQSQRALDAQERALVAEIRSLQLSQQSRLLSNEELEFVKRKIEFGSDNFGDKLSKESPNLNPAFRAKLAMEVAEAKSWLTPHVPTLRQIYQTEIQNREEAEATSRIHKALELAKESLKTIGEFTDHQRTRLLTAVEVTSIKRLIARIDDSIASISNDSKLEQSPDNEKQQLISLLSEQRSDLKLLFEHEKQRWKSAGKTAAK